MHTHWLPTVWTILILHLSISGLLSAADLPGRRIERSFLGSPASPAFGRPALPEFERHSAPSERVLPSAKPDAGRPSGQGTLLPGMEIREIRLVGNRALSDAELNEITQDYQGRWVTILELHELRQRLSRLYLQKGFINSGATIPDQEVNGAVVEIRIVEGGLGAIRIEGSEHLSAAFLRERIRLDARPPLNIYRLGERLQLLQSHPMIQVLKSELSPGAKAGDGAELNVRVRERPPHRLILDINNAHSPSVGEAALGVEMSHLSLSGRGDPIGLRMELGAGLSDFALNYALPLNASDTTLAFQLQHDRTRVVAEPFQDLDIAGRNWIAVASLSHPLSQGLNRQLLLSGGMEVEDSESTLAGAPFSFAPWAVNGQARVSLAYLGTDWLERGRTQVLALRSTFKLGLDAFGSTRRDEGPDSRFFSWLGQLRWARRLGPGRHQLIFRGDVQLTSDPLMTMEQYALGGLNSVRGYRTNQLVRDNALFASLEYRIGLDEKLAGTHGLQLALFSDYGNGWNRKSPAIDLHSIYSVGVGLLWDPDPGLHAEIYWGVPLIETEDLGYGIQDSGIHFRMVLRTRT